MAHYGADNTIQRGLQKFQFERLISEGCLVFWLHRVSLKESVEPEVIILLHKGLKWA